MIPEFAIREWGEQVPWTETEQVEQDLLICRALTEIYKDPYLASHLAFRGGTALHKLFLSPQPRYSEDIDLVQVKAEPIKETYDRIRAKNSSLSAGPTAATADGAAASSCAATASTGR